MWTSYTHTTYGLSNVLTDIALSDFLALCDISYVLCLTRVKWKLNKLLLENIIVNTISM